MRVNGNETELAMRIDGYGQCYFVEEIDANDMRSNDSEIHDPVKRSEKSDSISNGPNSAQSFKAVAMKERLSGPRGRLLLSDTPD